jgi:hypothetical protein
MPRLALTVLILNLLVAAIQGSVAITLLGVPFRTPSFRISLLLVAIWAGGRWWRRHPDRVTPARARSWLPGHLPEVLVVVLFAAGLTIRLWGIGFGAPLVLHPDEHVVVGKTVDMLKAGSLEPPVPYQYPTVIHYVLLPTFGLRYVKGRSAGLWTSLDDVDAGSFEFYELARAQSAVFGALTILLVFVLGRMMWPGAHGRWAGAIAAALLAVSFNHVKQSHYAVTDATLTFLVVLAFIAIVSAFRRGTPAMYALAGFAAGIACATKYSALPLVIVLVAAHLLDWPAARRGWRRLGAGLVAVPVGFFTGYPYALLNWPPFLEHLGWMSSYSGAHLFDAGERFAYIAEYAAESGFGLPTAILAGLAIVSAIHRRRGEDLLAVIFIAAALSLLSNTSFPFYPRYLLPLLPPALLLVGHFVARSVDRLRQSGGAWRFAPAAAVVVTCAAAWPQARESVQFVRYLEAPDTRVQAYDYIVRQFPAGSVIATEDGYLTLPDEYELLRWMPLESEDADEYLERGVDALVFSDVRDVGDATSPEARARHELKGRFPLQAAFPSGLGGSVGPTLTLHAGPRR